MQNKIQIFDSTLRDGAQAEGISFSVEDKMKIMITLDELGVDYIEAGNPGSNPKDLDFFERARKVSLKHSKLAAFGSTRRRDIKVEDDDNVKSMLSAETDTIVIFGKSWDFHVTDIIKTTLKENLAMIHDTVAFFHHKNKEVIYDAEHFFDGYKANPDYAIKTLEAAVSAGAISLVLCDTNGGIFPDEIQEIVKRIKSEFSCPIGIHCHNDSGMGVANSVIAVIAGATHVQGTYIGFGERCGNANLSTIIADLQLKRGYDCIPKDNLVKLTVTARRIAEISNVALNEREPFIGHSAFAHKGGMHIDGVTKSTKSFEHVSPEAVGNERHFLMSEVSGRNTILEKIRQVAPHLDKKSPETDTIMKKLKALEHLGYQFEGAESTFELVIRKELGKYKPFFELEHFQIFGSQPSSGEYSSSAIVKVKVDGVSEISAAEGDGPVHALDRALRKVLNTFYPELTKVHLSDYKVRVLDTQSASAAKVRVLIESTDGETAWTTVGVSTDIIEASWIALVDSIEYVLLKDLEKKMHIYL